MCDKKDKYIQRKGMGRLKKYDTWQMNQTSGASRTSARNHTPFFGLRVTVGAVKVNLVSVRSHGTNL